MSARTAPSSFPSDDKRLSAFGLSSSDFHSAFRSGLSRALARTRLAPPSAAGADLYHDTFEDLARILSERGWRRVLVIQQPRLVHPDGLIQLALASAVNVADPNPRLMPKTRSKGAATLRSLDHVVSATQIPFDLPELASFHDAPEGLDEAPLWFVLYERVGSGLRLSLGRPADVNSSSQVDQWSEEIPMSSLDDAGDLSIFDEGDDETDIEVPVAPR